MQRWIKLPNGTYVDANKIIYVGKMETFPRMDEESGEDSVAYAVNIGTNLTRDRQLSVVGNKEEILNLMKILLDTTTD